MSPDGVTTYVYDAGGQLAAEYSTAPNPDTGMEYVTTDHLGSTRVVTNSQGQPVQRWDYYPFGDTIPVDANRALVSGYTGASGERLKFTGKERDGETGLDYFGARYFSASTGQVYCAGLVGKA